MANAYKSFKMSDDELHAIEQWSLDGDKIAGSIKDHIAKHPYPAPYTGRFQKEIETLDALFKKKDLPLLTKPQSVLHVASSPAAVPCGNAIPLGEFLPTSVLAWPLLFARFCNPRDREALKNCVLCEIQLPAGTPALPVFINASSYVKHEMEILLGRSTRLRYLGERRVTMDGTFRAKEIDEEMQILSRTYVDANAWNRMKSLRSTELAVKVFEYVL